MTREEVEDIKADVCKRKPDTDSRTILYLCDALLAEMEKRKEIFDALKALEPYCEDKGMCGESGFERAWVQARKALQHNQE